MNQDVETVKTVLSASATLLGLQLVFVGILVSVAREKVAKWGVLSGSTLFMCGGWVAMMIIGVATIGSSVWFISNQGDVYDLVLVLFAIQLVAGTVLAILTAGLVIFRG